MLRRKADKWFVSFEVETEPLFPEKSVDVVCIDLGVKSKIEAVSCKLRKNLYANIYRGQTITEIEAIGFSE